MSVLQAICCGTRWAPRHACTCPQGGVAFALALPHRLRCVRSIATDNESTKGATRLLLGPHWTPTRPRIHASWTSTGQPTTPLRELDGISTTPLADLGWAAYHTSRYSTSTGPRLPPLGLYRSLLDLQWTYTRHPLDLIIYEARSRLATTRKGIETFDSHTKSD